MEIDYTKFFGNTEKPLDTIAENGGYCAIFRRIACIGDSLSSGEFEAVLENGEKSYQDMFEHSWGQYLARLTGSKVYNFSRGGMSAGIYCNEFADSKGFWSVDTKADAYIIALGVNDLFGYNENPGSIEDIDFENWRNNKTSFIGYFAQIIARYKEIQPKAKFFLVTFPNDGRPNKIAERHRELMYELAEKFSNTYVIDLYKYAPPYDDNFKKVYYLNGHLNPMGYLFTAKIISSYIDYIIRHNVDDFREVGFIGTDFHG